MDASYGITHEYCDDNALPAERTSIASLAPNQFYKICPGLHSLPNGTHAPLGQPRCGDGSNYSFLVSRPEERPSGEREKILIELQGGGACWDELTCLVQSYALGFPSFLDAVVGTSCSSANSLLGDLLLCSKVIGDTHFSEYTAIVLPYCTQDVHLGDEPNASYNGVRHVGAHNMYRTLEWVFDNFPDPSNIFLTGCSAGGTPLPVVYDLIHAHYSGDEHVSVIADSPVFLTPSYFLQNHMPNWNVKTILERIGFDFEAYKNNESFPLDLVDHAFERSNADDRWGFVTHIDDPTSLLYYTAMSGDLFGRKRNLLSSKQNGLSKSNRKMVGEEQSQWWTTLNSSISHMANSHGNFEAFVMEGKGHCNFGLYTPLQYAGFEEWASTIVRESDYGPASTDSPIPRINSISPTVGPPVMIPSTAGSVADPPALVPNTTDTMINMAAPRVSFSSAAAAFALLSVRFILSQVQ